MYDLLKTSKALGDETRLSIYRFLDQPQKSPASVRIIARRFKLHPSAVRQHLAKLEEAGLVSSETLKSSGSGRPQRVYRPRGPLLGAELLPRDYKLLCEMLLEFLAFSKVSVEGIREFGCRWGQNLVRTMTARAGGHHTPEEIARMLIRQFAGWGFEPKLISTTDRRIDIRLQNCIFREVVEFHPDLVCPLLHGVLDGMLSSFMGRQGTAIDNGIAHGKESCQLLVSLKPVP